MYDLLNKAKAGFESTFYSTNGQHHTYASFAPGRVNLIGEHTDYNQGFVLPCDLEFGTVIYGVGKIVSSSEEDSGKIRVASENRKNGIHLFEANFEMSPGEIHWVNYIKGVIFEYLADLPPKKSFTIDIYIASSVPIGAGLSSSASLTVSIATFLEALLEGNGIEISNDIKTKPRRCRAAEHKFVGTPCGIMDQFVSALAPSKHAILLDCLSETFEPVPLDDPLLAILIADSRVTHSLAERSNQYPVRVSQCESAAKILGVESLRNATEKDIERIDDPIIKSRARHVITENERCIKFADALKAKNYVEAGKAMFQSHSSLRDDYEVSVPELDCLVDIASSVDGVFGSRLTGAGFGGCTVSLVKADKVEDLTSKLKSGYKERYGIEPNIFVTKAG
eukprot:CAMPEP_0171472060 /NCGR_PEP_ID=MMETSP0946-20130122/1066_1 /TAXON_ID=109269 /ORGANISM="Vaucheria litorea, Strain CCMP2940" /LENGTH=393 /DNA_ID=CAMNT_0012001651 /DNA_START=148 /DNA_END=1326 /DNA_ORIENTATION=+